MHMRILLVIGVLMAAGIGALFSSACGSSAATSSNAPLLSVPAPIVTKISISDPVAGLVTVTGTAGAATAGNIVRAINLTQTTTTWRFERLLWGIAYAATTAEATVASDGSFVISDLTANLGDRIKITEVNSEGTEGDAVTLTAPYSPITLDFAPLDIAIDPDSATAYIPGVSGSTGVLAVLNVAGDDSAVSSTITLSSICTSPTAIDVKGGLDQVVIIDNTNKQLCTQPQDGTAATLFTTLDVSPINVAVHEDTGTALITNNTSGSNLSFDVAFLAFGSVLPAHVTDIGNRTHSTTSSVAVGTGGNELGYGVAVASFSDGTDIAYVISLSEAVVTGSGSTLEVGTPKEMRIYGTESGILVDGDGKAHILAISNSLGTVTISRTLTVGTSPVGVAVDATASKAYVSNTGDDTISVIDLTSGSESVLRTVTVADAPTHLIFKNSTLNQTAVVHESSKVVVLSN
jgi:YVTN family beta-propeller protein